MKLKKEIQAIKELNEQEKQAQAAKAAQVGVGCEVGPPDSVWWEEGAGTSDTSHENIHNSEHYVIRTCTWSPVRESEQKIAWKLFSHPDCGNISHFSARHQSEQFSTIKWTFKEKRNYFKTVQISFLEETLLFASECENTGNRVSQIFFEKSF